VTATQRRIHRGKFAAWLGLTLAAICAVFVLGMGAYWAHESAVRSLSVSLEEAIQHYHDEHGNYPESLGDLTIDYQQTDGASPDMLKSFRYERSGDSYILRRGGQ
jgi:hypothetical protein